MMITISCAGIVKVHKKFINFSLLLTPEPNGQSRLNQNTKSHIADGGPCRVTPAKPAGCLVFLPSFVAGNRVEFLGEYLPQWLK